MIFTIAGQRSEDSTTSTGAEDDYSTIITVPDGAAAEKLILMAGASGASAAGPVTA